MITVEDVRRVTHHKCCTMPHYDLERVGLERIRADFWGRLNYIWCHGTCDWPDDKRDAQAVYEAGKGRGPWWWTRKRYLRWWREEHDKQEPRVS